MKKIIEGSKGSASDHSPTRQRPMERFRSHPKFDEIYGALDHTSPEVKNIIERHQQGEAFRIPLVARIPGERNLILLTGDADVAAAKATKVKKLHVQIVQCSSLADALARLIESRQAQAKTLLDAAMEVFHLTRAHKKLAKERQQDAGGDRRSASARKNPASGSVPSGSDGSVRGETRNIVAKITHQSRERVTWMYALIEAARDQDKDNPRGTKIGKALADPEADLKAVAKRFGVHKPKASIPSAHAPEQDENDHSKPSGKVKSSSASHKQPRKKIASHANTAMLLATAEHLAVLEGDLKRLTGSTLAKATKRSLRVELLQALAWTLYDAARRLKILTDVDLEVPAKFNKRGPAAVRDFLLKRIVESSKTTRSELTSELGPKGAETVKAVRAGKRELEPKEALAMISALVRTRHAKPARPV